MHMMINNVLHLVPRKLHALLPGSLIFDVGLTSSGDLGMLCVGGICVVGFMVGGKGSYEVVST